MKRFAFAVPGDLATPTGGYAYDRRMIAELGDLGWQIDLLDLGEGFPVARRSDARDRANAAAGDARRPPHRRRWLGARRLAGSRVAACRPQSAAGAGASSARAGMRDCRWSKPTRCAQASARRSQPCKASSSPARPRHGWSLPITACRPSALPSRGRAAIRRRWRKAARTASCGCCRSARWCRARALTC